MTNTITSAVRIADRVRDSIVAAKSTATARGCSSSGVAIGSEPERPIRLLVFTSLYPNSEQPRHGIFVEERLRKLIETGRVSATVVAPVPWFPFRSRRFGAYAAFARVPAREERHGIQILHPRYPVIPKVGMNAAAALMHRAVLPVVRQLFATGAFDFIDAHYLYPDGVVAARLGQLLGLPVVATARGNDVTLIPLSVGPRRRILEAVARMSAVISVSAALRTHLIELGAAGDKIHVLRNGVDLQRFRPVDGYAVREKHGLDGTVWLAVGHLIERKGVHFVVEALARCENATLVVAGDGPEERALHGLAQRLGVADRVRFIGAVPHDDLPAYYSAADALFLASSREGMPNVVLESIACGTPVVAAPFAGVEELVHAPEAGEVAERRTADAMAAAWQRLAARGVDRSATRRFAEGFGWTPVVNAQCRLYGKVLATRGHVTAQEAAP